MASNERRLRVDATRCIGCRACTTVCPAGLITLTDSDHRRMVRYVALCAEDCDRCATACPTQAIHLESAAAPAGEGTILHFALAACEHCRAPLAPVEMLDHLRAAIPAQMQTDAEGQDWLTLCPGCRQQLEAEGMARETLMTRWPA
jgi:ferredoxin